MLGALSFRVLGPLDVRGPGGEQLDLGGPQPQLVLAQLLVAERRVVPVDALLHTLWGDEQPDSATGTLQTYVSRLRRALGPQGGELLRRESSGYRLDVQPDQVDAWLFERLAAEGRRLLDEGSSHEAAGTLREALGLWRGDVLDAADAEFVRTASVHWQERRSAALEDLFDAELRVGRAAAVVPDLAAEVRREPLRERLRGLLALALYRSGRQADALATLEEARRLLGDELGLDLSPELSRLRSRILEQDPDLALPAAVAGRPPAGLRPGAAVLEESSGELIGRTAELRSVLAALDEALHGDGCRYVLIEGEPGMGKTRLAQELMRRAEVRGAATLSAGTLEGGAAPAYGPWQQLVRAARGLTGTLPDAVERLMQAARNAPPGTAAGVVAAAHADSVAETAIALAGQRGLVVLIDDLQWADPASLDLLAGLAPRIGRAPVLLVATVRELEVGRHDAVVDALAQIMRQVGTRRVTLRGLSLAESGQLLARTTEQALPDQVVAAVHARSEGNPFFTTELGRMITEEGGLPSLAAGTAVPTGVRDVLQRRVARLPAATRELMQTAAVLGRQVGLDLLARVADRPLLECLDDLEPALVTRLLEVPASDPGSVRFTHALVREALADGMTSLRRARLHLRAADGIEATAGETDDTAEIVAEHLWNAAAVGASARAAAALERAAQVALKRQALVSAESLLERAAQLHRSAGTDGGLAELRVLRQLCFVGAALHGYAVNADSAMVRRAQELAKTNRRPDILLDLIWADWAGCDTGGQPRRGEQLVLEAERLFGAEEDPLLRGGIASMRAFTERHFGRMTSAYEHSDLAVRSFTAAPESQEAGFYLNGFLTTIGFRHWASALLGNLDRQQLESDYQAQHLPFGRITLSLFGAAATMALADHAGLRLFADRMRAADPDMLLSFWSAAAELYSALSLLHRQDYTGGLELLERGRAHMREAGGRTMLAGLFAEAALTLADAGLLHDAQRLLTSARAELAEASELAYQPVVELAAAHVAAAHGDLDGARHHQELAIEVATRHGSLGLVARIERERPEVLSAPDAAAQARG